MAIQFQYNKTALQELNKQLKIRQNALPILKNKEAALRLEVKKVKHQAEDLDRLLTKKMDEQQYMAMLWEEFNFNLLEIKEIHVQFKKVAGVSVPALDRIEFQNPTFSLYNQPAWFATGIEMAKEWITMANRKKIYYRSMELLEHARKKTTQKVNLYEKVQIPGYEDAIRKIKRFLEDKENLAKAAQKIVKNRQAANSEFT